MANIVVLNKENLATLQNLQGSQHAVLNQAQAAVVQVGYSKEDIAAIERSGTKAIIRLKNGEKIVIENFFNENGQTENELVFPDREGHFDVAEFDETGRFINYNPIQKLTELATSQQWLQTQPTVVELSAPLAEAAWYQKPWVKPALVVLGAEAIYLAAFDDDSSKPKDITAPESPSATLDPETADKITGKAEARARVYAINEEGKEVAHTYADSEGNYTLTLTTPLTDGARVAVYAKDAAGNISRPVAVTGSKDTIAPEQPQAQFNDEGSIISGKAEPGAKIYVYAEDGTTLIAGPITAANDGTFAILLAEALPKGSKAQVVAVDAAGNRSPHHNVEVGKDTIAPEQAQLEVDEKGKHVHGIAEANATVEIRDAQGKVVESTQADDTGRFDLALDTAITEQAKWVLVVKDAAGNESPSISLKPKLDTLAPQPVQASVNADGNQITGTAEPFAQIKVTAMSNGQPVTIGTGQANAEGDFEVDLITLLANNASASVYAIDAANNQSVATQVVGTKDTIAPNKISVNTLIVNDAVGEEKGKIPQHGETDDTRPSFEGYGEANATLTVYNHGIAIHTLQVPNTGIWKYIPEHDLSVGVQRFSFSQMDASGNTSAMSDVFSFTVVEPESPLVTESDETLLNVIDEPSAAFNVLTSPEPITWVDTKASNTIELNHLLSSVDQASDVSTTPVTPSFMSHTTTVDPVFELLFIDPQSLG